MSLLTAERSVWIALALAAVSIGLAAAPLPWRFAGESGLPPPPPTRFEQAQAAISIEPILALAPFGSPAATEDWDAEAPVSDLGLTLSGVVIAAPSEASIAMISGSSQPVQAYAVGQTVGETATLVEVHGGYVVLEVDGRREVLAFPDSAGSAPAFDEFDAGTAALGALADAQTEFPAADDASDTGVAALRALAEAQSEASLEDEAQAEAPAPDAADDAADAPEDVLGAYRQRIEDDPQLVLDELGLVASSGGYEVGDGAADAVRRAGLRPGDLVTKVNGQQVGNIEQDRDLFAEVAAGDHARLEVTRDGRRTVMSFPLR